MHLSFKRCGQLSPTTIPFQNHSDFQFYATVGCFRPLVAFNMICSTAQPSDFSASSSIFFFHVVVFVCMTVIFVIPMNPIKITLNAQSTKRFCSPSLKLSEVETFNISKGSHFCVAQPRKRMKRTHIHKHKLNLEKFKFCFTFTE